MEIQSEQIFNPIIIEQLVGQILGLPTGLLVPQTA